ncbi:MAG: hypothetical protein GXO32_03320 [Crenarchaeota archaeon]|nr:hypothetical protein [Thermoproteota archaeon]
MSLSVIIDLVRNPKTVRTKPFVARVNLENGSIEFLKPAVPAYRKGVLVEGEYLVNPGDLLIIRKDVSSRGHSDQYYILARVEANGELKELAWIRFNDRAPQFSDEKLKEIYATTNGERRVVRALIRYAKEVAAQAQSEEEVLKRCLAEVMSVLEKYHDKLSSNPVFKKIYSEVKGFMGERV